MKIVKLSESVAVSEQIVATDVAQIAAAGYKVVVNNRPDDEVADQPTSDELAAAAHAVGISYYHLPITADSFPGPDSALMASLLDNTNEPVLAFCRSGTRSANLWVATRQASVIESARNHARTLGYDLAMSITQVD